MDNKIIDGKAISKQIRQEIKAETNTFKQETGAVPGLAFILVGENPASQVYVRMKGKACEEVGFYSVTKELPDDVSQQELVKLIDAFNNDPKIHGILTQLPLPDHIDEAAVIESINPDKDVDGFHPVNVGKLLIGLNTFRPCTPAGIQELLIRSDIDPAGKHVVVVGRSNIVGKPIGNILVQKQKWANAVVTICHTGAKDISYYTKQADILIAAVGRANVITGDMLKEGVVVIDVGVNRIDAPDTEKGYKLVGDVDFDSAKEFASAITPVPGGVGPMTIAMLLANTLQAAKQHVPVEN